MEDHAQEQYLDSPPATPVETTTPTVQSSPPVMKPLPPVPSNATPPANEQDSDGHQRIPSTLPPRYHIVSPSRNSSLALPISFPPYRDAEPGQDLDDDDVPLAHLYPYPTEAPPAYHVAVGHDFRDTLIMHIPVQPNNYSGIAGDEEAQFGFGDDDLDDDHPRHLVEMWAARAVIWIVLLAIAAFVAWQVALYKDLL